GEVPVVAQRLRDEEQQRRQPDEPPARQADELRRLPVAGVLELADELGALGEGGQCEGLPGVHPAGGAVRRCAHEVWWTTTGMQVWVVCSGSASSPVPSRPDVPAEWMYWQAYATSPEPCPTADSRRRPG